MWPPRHQLKPWFRLYESPQKSGIRTGVSPLAKDFQPSLRGQGLGRWDYTFGAIDYRSARGKSLQSELWGIDFWPVNFYRQRHFASSRNSRCENTRPFILFHDIGSPSSSRNPFRVPHRLPSTHDVLFTVIAWKTSSRFCRLSKYTKWVERRGRSETKAGRTVIWEWDG